MVLAGRSLFIDVVGVEAAGSGEPARARVDDGVAASDGGWATTVDGVEAATGAVGVVGDGMTDVGGKGVDGGVGAAASDGVEAVAGEWGTVAVGEGFGAGAIFIRHRATRTAPASHHLQRGKIFRSFSSSPIIFFHMSSGTSEG
jgi:hypothetical protein